MIPHLRHLVVFCVLLGQMSESAREGRGDVAVPSSFAVVLSLPDHVARVEQCHLTEDNGPSPFLDLPVSLGQCKAELQNSFYSAAVLVTALVFRLTVLALFLVRDTFHARVVLVEQYSLIRDPEASRHLDSSSWLDQYTAALLTLFMQPLFESWLWSWLRCWLSSSCPFSLSCFSGLCTSTQDGRSIKSN